jgi:hypothetical protein
MVRSSVSILGMVALLMGISAGSALAQNQPPAPVTLADVVAEIRELRAAIEESGKQQLLASVLATQQSRIQPLNAQLYETRKEIEAAGKTARLTGTAVRDLHADASERGREMLARAKAALQEASDHESALRRREAEIRQELSIEEGKFSDLMAQFFRTIRR